MSEEDIQVEAFPVETVYDTYRCRYGHEQAGSGETTATNEKFGSITTGPMCVQCWMQSLGKRFRTRKVEK